MEGDQKRINTVVIFHDGDDEKEQWDNVRLSVELMALQQQVEKLRYENEKLWREVAYFDAALHDETCGENPTTGCYWCALPEGEPFRWSEHGTSFKSKYEF